MLFSELVRKKGAMNREERFNFLVNNRERTEYQVKKIAEENHARARMMKIKTTIEKEEEWARNWLNKQATYDKYANCLEIVDEMDFKERIDVIRDDYKKVNLMFIYIKNGKIVEHIVRTGNDILNLPFCYQQIEEIILEEKRSLDFDKVYIAHNRPCNFSAFPIKGEESNIKILDDILFEKEIELADYGIVTIDDYWSYAQTREEKKYDA